MPEGTIKFYRPKEGYGFIAPDGGGDDVFFHVTQVRDALPSDIVIGLRCQFDEGVNPRTKRPLATNVRVTGGKKRPDTGQPCRPMRWLMNTTTLEETGTCNRRSHNGSHDRYAAEPDGETSGHYPLDPRLAYLARASAKLILVEAGVESLDEAIADLPCTCGGVMIRRTSDTRSAIGRCRCRSPMRRISWLRPAP